MFICLDLGASIMGKQLHVFLTNEEERKLEDLCEVNGCTQSHLVKYAISEMHANSQAPGEHNGHNVRILLSPREEVIANVRQGLTEGKELLKAHRVAKIIEDEENRPFREATENAEKLTKELFK